MKKINLRKEAKGRECQIRIPSVCNKNHETVVLAHLNSKGVFGVGVGQKVPDIFGAWACSDCHSAVDGRAPVPDGDEYYFSRDEVKIMFYDGVFRTQNILLDEGKIGITHGR